MPDRSNPPRERFVRCERCLLSLKVTDDRNEDARVLRKAKTGQGVCVNCAATQFLRTMEPLATVLSARGPEVLRSEAAQVQFGAMLAAGDSDAKGAEVDWNAVIEHWELPL